MSDLPEPIDLLIEEVAPAPRAKPLWKSVLKWAVFLAIVYFVGWTLVKQFRQLDWKSIHFRWAYLLGAFVALTVVYAARTISFRLLLQGYDVRLGWNQTNVVAWVPQIGKYIPGNVASIAGAVHFLRRFGVGGAVALAVVLVMDALAVLTGMISGVPILLWQPVREKWPSGWVWCGLVIFCGVAALHPAVFSRLINFALRKLKKQADVATPPLHSYLLPAVFGFLQWVLAGLALWMCAASVADVPLNRIGLFIEVCGIAYTAGYLTPFPGGLGIRDGIFQWTLAGLVGPPMAVAVVAMRIVQTLVEILMAGVGVWVLRRVERTGRSL